MTTRNEPPTREEFDEAIKGIVSDDKETRDLVKIVALAYADKQDVEIKRLKADRIKRQ